jgi:hypothetical protein
MQKFSRLRHPGHATSWLKPGPFASLTFKTNSQGCDHVAVTGRAPRLDDLSTAPEKGIWRRHRDLHSLRWGGADRWPTGDAGECEAVVPSDEKKVYIAYTP